MKQKFHRSLALQRYDVSYGIKTLADFEAVRAAFYVVMFTPYTGFRFRDWNDYQLNAGNSTLTLVSGTSWQINRFYSFGGVGFNRRIIKLVGTPAILRLRSGVTSTVTATVNANTGVATITDHVSGDTYSAVGEFDVPVTFVDDALDGVELDGNWNAVLQNLPSIKLEELDAASALAA